MSFLIRCAISLGAALTVGASQPAASEEAEAAWVDLFNGRDLSGWLPVNVAPDTFTVRDETIVCSGSPAGFLLSECAYENFVLELEWRHLSPAGNSGVLLWADDLPATGAYFPRAVEVQVLDPGSEVGRANAGRQFTGHGDIMAIRGAELTPMGRISENRRRSLPTELRVKASPEWNHYRIECRDGRIRLAVNGVFVTEAEQASPRVGFIGLQSEGSEIHFRNLRIQPLPGSSATIPPKPGGYRALFNGRDFQGWVTTDPGITRVWSVKDGVISSQRSVPGKDLHLWTEAHYRDFDLIVDWRMPAKPEPRSRATFTPDGLYVLDEHGQPVRRDILDAGDSGIFFRGAPLYQVNIWSQPMGSGDINERHKDPALPAELRRAMLPRVHADRPFGEWNRFRIILRGERVTVWLNDTLIIEDVPLDGLPAEGPIGLQYHRDQLEFSNLFVRPIRPEFTVHPVSHYEQTTRAEVYAQDSSTRLPYRLYVPPMLDPTRKYPLVLSLHGAGGRGDDNRKQLGQSTAGWICEEVQARHPCFILMPQCPKGKKWVETPFRRGSYDFDAAPISDHFEAVRNLLDRIVEEYPIDRDRLYIMGASMGGYATWNMITRYPALFAAAVPVCGAGDPGKAADLISLPIWAFHGERDDVVPPQGSMDMIDAIKQAGGARARVTIYQDVKHESYNLAWKEEELVAWLFAQRKPERK